MRIVPDAVFSHRRAQMLENRTKQSRHEMDMIEKLEELKDLNQRQAHVDYEGMLQQYSRQQEAAEQRQELEDEEYIRYVHIYESIS